MDEIKMTEIDRRLLDLLDPKPKISCYGCKNLTSKGCGTMVYVPLTSSSGEYKKSPDYRCKRGV